MDVRSNGIAWQRQAEQGHSTDETGFAAAWQGMEENSCGKVRNEVICYAGEQLSSDMQCGNGRAEQNVARTRTATGKHGGARMSVETRRDSIEGHS